MIDLPPRDQKGRWRAVIESPQGSRNKLKFDRELGAFRVTESLPAGMSFPFDFGFIPGTRGGDGDPIDVLILMDAPAYPGTVVGVRLLGVIQAEQEELVGWSATTASSHWRMGRRSGGHPGG
jgi:inorganic pyrophosphatase